LHLFGNFVCNLDQDRVQGFLRLEISNGFVFCPWIFKIIRSYLPIFDAYEYCCKGRSIEKLGMGIQGHSPFNRDRLVRLGNEQTVFYFA